MLLAALLLVQQVFLLLGEHEPQMLPSSGSHGSGEETL